MDPNSAQPLNNPLPPAPPPPSKWLKLVVMVICAVVLFSGGWLLGHGSQAKHKTGNFDYSSVDKLYNLLQKNYDGELNSAKLLDGIKHGLVSATGDPYTVYFDKEESQKFQEQLSGSFSGIGAELGAEKGKIVIVSPLSGYPAQKAGLQSKDIVAAIDGKPTTDMSVDEAVSKIRGPAGSQVKLTVIRGDGQPKTFTITRAKIKIPSVKSHIEGNIGYLRISQFSEDTVARAQKAAQSFKDAAVKAVILDLRGNPGGFLDGAVDVSSLWLDQGKTVVSERRGGQVQDTQKAKGGNLLKGLPTVVLIDSGSASASEITAGALHDNKAATLVGVKSFGKGSVQTIECLGVSSLNNDSCDGPEVKITIARWYTPDGVNIDKHGIKPDVTVQAGKNDPQKAKALQLLKQKIH